MVRRVVARMGFALTLTWMPPACAGSSTDPALPTQPVEVDAGSFAQFGQTDLSPVAEPYGISARIRLRSAHIGVRFLAAGNAPGATAPSLSSDLSGRDWGELVALDDTLDVVALSRGGSLGQSDVAVSVGLAHFQDAVRAMQKSSALSNGPDGSIRIAGGTGGTATRPLWAFLSSVFLGPEKQKGAALPTPAPSASAIAAPEVDHTPCAVYPSPQGERARLVCATSESVLERVAPYMTRTLPRKTQSNAPAYVELALAELRPRIGTVETAWAGALSRVWNGDLGTAPTPRVEADAVPREMARLVRDLDSVAMEVEPSEDGTLRIGFRFPLPRGNGKVPAILRSEPNVSPMPTSLRHLAKATSFAYAGPRLVSNGGRSESGTLIELALSPLASRMTEKELRPVRDALGALGSFAPIGYMSTGPLRDLPESQARLRARSGREDEDAWDARSSVLASMFGVRAVLLDVPVAEVTGSLRTLSSTWHHKGFQRALQKAYVGGTAPTLAIEDGARSAHGGGLRVRLTAPLGPLRAKPSLTRGPDAQPMRQPFLSLYFHFIPDGARTWMVVAASRRDAEQAARDLASTPSGPVDSRFARASAAVIWAPRTDASLPLFLRAAFAPTAESFDEIALTKWVEGGASDPVAFALGPVQGALRVASLWISPKRALEIVSSFRHGLGEASPRGSVR